MYTYIYVYIYKYIILYIYIYICVWGGGGVSAVGIRDQSSCVLVSVSKGSEMLQWPSAWASHLEFYPLRGCFYNFQVLLELSL